MSRVAPTLPGTPITHGDRVIGYVHRIEHPSTLQTVVEMVIYDPELIECISKPLQSLSLSCAYIEPKKP
jgi:hypothetical protein